MHSVSKRIMAVSLLSLIGVLMLTSVGCMRQTGRKTFVQTLFEPFSATAQYLIGTETEDTVCGTVNIARNQGIRLDFMSPDPFTGLSLQSDATGLTPVLSLSYSGIQADFPKRYFETLSAMLAFFTDETACLLDRLPSKDFQPCPEPFTLQGLIKVEPFQVTAEENGKDILCIYDRLTGTPLYMKTVVEGKPVELKIMKFKANPS